MDFLISRTDALGDTIQTIPVASVIKSRFKGSRVFFLVRSPVEELLKENPDIDGVFVLNRELSLFKKIAFLYRLFKKMCFHVYIYSGGSHLPSLMSFILGVKIRGGILAKWPSFLFLNRGLRQNRSKVLMSEAEYNIQLLEIPDLVSDSVVSYVPEVKIHLLESEKQVAELVLSQYDLGSSARKQFVVVHPGMTGHTLNWPMRSYADFVYELDRKMKGIVHFLISYTQSDMRYISELKREFSLPKYNEVSNRISYLDGGIIGLRVYMAVLIKASLFLGPSTGTLHIANALNVKCIGLYSPIKVQSAKRWHPVNMNARTKVLTPDLNCNCNFVCDMEKCPHYFCMEGLTVEKVVKEAYSLFLMDNSGVV